MTTKPMTRYIVVSAYARMPAGCWGRYARVAVVEIDASLPAGWRPRMISERARGVVRIVRTWERLHIGSTPRCAEQRALAQARALATELTAQSARRHGAGLAGTVELADFGGVL